VRIKCIAKIIKQRLSDTNKNKTNTGKKANKKLSSKLNQKYKNLIKPIKTLGQWADACV